MISSKDLGIFQFVDDIERAWEISGTVWKKIKAVLVCFKLAFDGLF